MEYVLVVSSVKVLGRSNVAVNDATPLQSELQVLVAGVSEIMYSLESSIGFIQRAELPPVQSPS